MTAYTHRLTEGILRSRILGQTQIKGVEEPLNVYEVLGAGPLRTRLQVAARRGLTRFVGRQSEMEQMQRALRASQSGPWANRRRDGRARVRQVAVVLRVQAAPPMSWLSGAGSLLGLARQSVALSAGD